MTLTKCEILKKITEKRELSKLPEKDVELAFSHFEKRQVSEEEKIRLTRELLNKVFWPFRSKKLLSLKDKNYEWILRKHLSTRERLPFYGKLYERIFKNETKNFVLFDLGAGINGISYRFLSQKRLKLKYVGIEAVGQLVDLMNFYFKKEKFNAQAISMSLFEIDNLKKIICKEKGRKIVFLFKVLDSLEALERNFSKKLLSSISPLCDKIVISFPTESMSKRQKFRVKRYWLINFLSKFHLLRDDFEISGEKFLVFEKEQTL
ncbi:hypothetical protein FJZ20_01055 [Candidatus Pacearchaeota archaeon]|nr:hypothetical protein [Candidatus Pacearchaeota archaeon]